jgi:hypothetical protein
MGEPWPDTRGRNNVLTGITGGTKTKHPSTSAASILFAVWFSFFYKKVAIVSEYYHYPSKRFQKGAPSMASQLQQALGIRRNKALNDVELGASFEKLVI